MIRKITLLLAVAAGFVLAGCASKPQLPVGFAAASVSPAQKVGVGVAKLPKPTVSTPGADCLLCAIAAGAMNLPLGKHTDTLTLDEFVAVKAQLAEVLRKKGATVVLLPDDVDVASLQDASGSQPNLAKKNFSPLKQKYGVDKLVLVQLDQVGFERSYAAYIPTSDPKSVLRGAGYMVNLADNTYDWYQPLSIVKSAQGPWDEPRFPGLTNAYFQVLELGKDSLLRALQP